MVIVKAGELSPQIAVGSFTRATDAASGDVAYTGLGFQPVGIFFTMHNATSLLEMSWGYTDGTTDQCLRQYAGFGVHSGHVIYWDNELTQTLEQVAVLKSFDADGFTLTWTLVGSPATETMECRYYAIGPAN